MHRSASHHDTRTSSRRRPHITEVAPPAPKTPLTIFRRSDNSICHRRCDRPLAFQGVRGQIEADFYCFACLTHVTIPVAVLDVLPVNLGGDVVGGA